MSPFGVLTGKQGRALASLLAGTTVTEAATEARVSVRTLERWLRDDSFRCALREAQGEALQLVGARLPSLLAGSLDVLKADLESGNARVQTRAALGILTHYSDLASTVDFEGRLDELEKQLEKGGT